MILVEVQRRVRRFVMLKVGERLQSVVSPSGDPHMKELVLIMGASPQITPLIVERETTIRTTRNSMYDGVLLMEAFKEAIHANSDLLGFS